MKEFSAVLCFFFVLGVLLLSLAHQCVCTGLWVVLGPAVEMMPKNKVNKKLETLRQGSWISGYFYAAVAAAYWHCPCSLWNEFFVKHGLTFMYIVKQKLRSGNMTCTEYML